LASAKAGLLPDRSAQCPQPRYRTISGPFFIAEFGNNKTLTTEDTEVTEVRISNGEETENHGAGEARAAVRRFRPRRVLSSTTWLCGLNDNSEEFGNRFSLSALLVYNNATAQG
jgi:hypothetical protein